MEVRGRVHKIEDTQQVSATFKKRGLVLMMEGQYPQYPMFEFSQDRTSLLDAFRPGDEVEVSFDLNGREWTSPQGEVKYFTTLRGYMVKKITLEAPQAVYTTQPQQHQPAYNNPPANTGTPTHTAPATNLDGDDDLPF